MSLAEATARAKHDLGKYVAFQLRWLTSDCSDADLLEALQADVLNTRRGPDGSESAMSIWTRLKPELAGADIQPVDAGVATLASHAEDLAEGTLSRDQMETCAEAARVVARHLAALARVHRS